MNLLNKIEQIRKKPEPARRRAALAASVLLTGVVALVWLTVFLVKKDFSAAGSRDFSQGASPFSLIKDFIKTVESSVKSK